MEIQLYKEDLKKADELMHELLTHLILNKEKYLGIQYDRIITVLVETGYVKNVTTHLLTTDYTKLYFNNGGASAIYKTQQRTKKIEKWQYTNIKWTNRRSWIAICISLSVLIWEIVSFFVR